MKDALRVGLIVTLLPLGFAIATFGQALSNKPIQPLTTYVTPMQVPSHARPCLLALGKRLQAPGNERLTLVGQHTANGKSSPAQLTWEAPGRLRYDRNGASASSLLFDDASGLANAASVSQADQDVLESLLYDSPESFLYSFVNGRAVRSLGGRFRADDGKTPNYQGPWFDIYQVVTRIDSVAGAPSRPKLYYFDSKTKLLVRTVYSLSRAGSKVTVSTEYSQWTTRAGFTTPGQIVRKENGTPIFTFDVAAAAVGPPVADGLFPKH